MTLRGGLRPLWGRLLPANPEQPSGGNDDDPDTGHDEEDPPAPPPPQPRPPRQRRPTGLPELWEGLDYEDDHTA